MLFKVCNSVLNSKFSMLASDTSEEAKAFGEKFWSVAITIVSAIIAIAGAFSAIWGIMCAIKMMKADNNEKRDNAKKSVIYTIVGVVVAVMLILILLFVKKNLPNWIGDKPFQPQQ